MKHLIDYFLTVTHASPKNWAGGTYFVDSCHVDYDFSNQTTLDLRSLTLRYSDMSNSPNSEFSSYDKSFEYQNDESKHFVHIGCLKKAQSVFGAKLSVHLGSTPDNLENYFWVVKYPSNSVKQGAYNKHQPEVLVDDTGEIGDQLLDFDAYQLISLFSMLKLKLLITDNREKATMAFIENLEHVKWTSEGEKYMKYKMSEEERIEHLKKSNSRIN